MHIKKIALTLLFSINLFAAPSGVYVEVGAAKSLNDKLKSETGDFVYDKGTIGSVMLGYQADLYRFELEGRYVKEALSSFSNVSSSGDLTKNSQMLNAYYCGYNESKYVSSVGAGVGITNISTEKLSQSSVPQEDIKEDAILSLQGMLSVGYIITPSVTTTLKYTYFYTAKSGDLKANGENIFTFSLRYLF